MAQQTAEHANMLTRCPSSASLFVVVPKSPVAVHQVQFQMIAGSQLVFEDVVPGSEHLANLHEGFVLGLRNDEEGVGGHGQADGAEDQVTERTGGKLWCRDEKKYE